VQESRLIEHFKVLNTYEATDFLRFTKAMCEYEKDIPEDTFLFVKYVLKHIGEESKLKKETVYKNIYPREVWKNGRIDKLMSYALRLFKSYLVFQKYSKDDCELNEALALSAFYKKNGLQRLFELNVKQFSKITEEIKQPNSDDFLNQFLLEKEVFNFKTEFNTRKEGLNLPETVYALDIFYIVQRLELILGALVQNISLPFEDSEKNNSLLEKILMLASHQTYTNNEIIQLYIQAIQLQIANNLEITDNIYNKFITKIDSYKSKLNQQQIFTFCTVARIYCTFQYNKGRSEYLSKLFNLFKMQLSIGALYQEGKIRASTLQNIVTTAIKLKEYDFVKSFLAEHENKIAGTFQADLIVAYNYALYFFEVDNYKKSQDLLPNYLDLEDIFYALAARRLEIKILFETENNSKYDILGNKLDAFKNYLFENKKNQKISELLFNSNNNFIDLFKQIRITLKKDKERVEKLTLKLNETAAYAEREWLLEKLNALNS
jgi:hypothetical protein